jgi:hypothetical protein
LSHHQYLDSISHKLAILTFLNSRFTVLGATVTSIEGSYECLGWNYFPFVLQCSQTWKKNKHFVIEILLLSFWNKFPVWASVLIPSSNFGSRNLVACCSKQIPIWICSIHLFEFGKQLGFEPSSNLGAGKFCDGLNKLVNCWCYFIWIFCGDFSQNYCQLFFLFGWKIQICFHNFKLVK